MTQSVRDVTPALEALSSDVETTAADVAAETESQQQTDAPDEQKGGDTQPDSREEEEGGDDEPLPLDQVFGILKNQRRRHVLQYLYDSEGQVTLSDVAEQIAAWENDKEVREISSSERKRVYVGLYQCHLPKMDSVGVVDFNKPRGIIELGDNAEDVYEYLDTDDDADEHPWHFYSMSVSALGAVMLGFGLVLRPMTALPVVDIAVGLSIITFSAYALASMTLLRDPDDEDAADEA